MVREPSLLIGYALLRVRAPRELEFVSVVGQIYRARIMPLRTNYKL
jgi:hypothetical protein